MTAGEPARGPVRVPRWPEAAAEEPDFAACSETPLYVGRAVAALAADPHVASKTGRVLSSWDLAKEYGFTDADGRSPDWGAHFESKYGPYRRCDEAFYDSWRGGPVELMFDDWP